MKKLAIPLLATALILAGCAATGPTASSEKTASPAPSPVVTPVPTPTPTGPAKSVRGNLIKAVGQPFYLGDPSKGQQVATFVVNAITVDFECTNPYATAPTNGHFVKLDITGETTAALAPSQFFLAGGSWKVITDSGTTVNADPWNAASNSCLNQGERIPNVVGPGEKVAGSLVLDVPTPHGTIVLTEGAGTAWEWAY